MIFGRLKLAAFVLLLAALLGHLASAATIPEDNRIVAIITKTIVAPAASPATQPTDVAVDATGNVYIADGVNDRILKLSPKGELDAVLTGPADSPLAGPVGITLDKDGVLWVADTGNHRLVVRSADGQKWQHIDLPESPDHKPANPTGLCVRLDGLRTYVADCDNQRILMRDNASGQITPFGQWGVALGQFRWPFRVAMGSENHVLITEAVGARVQQISQDNRWGGQIGQFGVAMGKLYRPKGLALAADGRIFVGDSSLGVIQAFNPQGNLMGVLTDAAGTPLHFEHPMGMCFDSHGLLYVVELSADRVAVVSFNANK